MNNIQIAMQNTAEQRYEILMKKEKLLRHVVFIIKDMRNDGFKLNRNMKYDLLEVLNNFEKLDV